MTIKEGEFGTNKIGKNRRKFLESLQGQGSFEGICLGIHDGQEANLVLEIGLEVVSLVGSLMSV